MPGLQPYARLCHPAWVSANIAYLKDMDYPESRLSTLGLQKTNKVKTGDADQVPTTQPKNKRQGKGSNAGSISLAPRVAHVEQPFELPAQSLKSCDDPGALDLVDEFFKSSFNIDHDVPDPRSKQVFSCVNLMHSFCKSAVSAPTALGSFIRQSLKLADHACTMEKPSRALWPVPPVELDSCTKSESAQSS